MAINKGTTILHVVVLQRSKQGVGGLRVEKQRGFGQYGTDMVSCMRMSETFIRLGRVM